MKKICYHDQYDLSYQYGRDLHSCSHGESFLQLVENRFWDNGYTKIF